MAKMTYADLTKTVDLDSRTSSIQVSAKLQPCAGWGTPVAGSTHLDSDDKPTYQWATVANSLQDVWPDRTSLTAIALDSQASMANRMEKALATAIDDEHPLLSRMPRIRLSDSRGGVWYDYTLPHRFADAHLRHNSMNGEPLSQNSDYVELRRHDVKHAMPLMMTSPISLLLGYWDSQNPTMGSRETTKIEGVTYGILSDQDRGMDRSKRGGFRTDPVSPNMKVTRSELEAMLKRDPELARRYPDKTLEQLFKGKKRDERINLSHAGFGSLPASGGLNLVPCHAIERKHVIVASRLRELRFGLGREGDVAARALLTALGYNLVARASFLNDLRRNCALTLIETPTVSLDDGTVSNARTIDFPSVDEADELLEEALDNARQHGVEWNSQTMDVTMNASFEDAIYAAAKDADAIEIEDGESSK